MVSKNKKERNEITNMNMKNDKTMVVKLDSSNLDVAEYDPFMKVLTLKFWNGGLYEYIGVEKSVFTDLKEAPSAGKFFLAEIKRKYEFLKRMG